MKPSLKRPPKGKMEERLFDFFRSIESFPFLLVLACVRRSARFFSFLFFFLEVYVRAPSTLTTDGEWRESSSVFRASHPGFGYM